MIRGFVLTVQPLLFGGYVHGPQIPRSLRRGRRPVLGLMFMGGKRSLSITPVGGAPKVQTEKKRVADCSVKPKPKIMRKPMGSRVNRGV